MAALVGLEDIVEVLVAPVLVEVITDRLWVEVCTVPLWAAECTIALPWAVECGTVPLAAGAAAAACSR